MPASGWMRSRKIARAEQEHVWALVRAAARGDSMDQLVEQGAETLLATAEADRAGVWLTGKHSGQTGPGSIVETVAAPIPEQWKHLDISIPFLRTALDRSEPLQIELDPGGSTPPLGPLMGMRSAIWIPLRARDLTVGLAMAAYSHQHAAPHMEALRGWADEIALAVAYDRDMRRWERQAEELRSRLRLTRAILRGVSTDSILPQIARAARHFVPAEFVVLGRAETLPVLAEGWDGPNWWRTLLEHGHLRRAWRRVVEEGHEVEIQDESILVGSNAQSDEAISAIERIVALPIEGRNQIHGVLMAGLVRSEDSADDFLRLEAYALQAAVAFDQEIARGERTQWMRSFDRVVEESGECLLVADQKGRIRGSSLAARLLLQLDPESAGEMLFEDFFSPGARDAVSKWRERVTAQIVTAQAGPLDASLASGAAVRVHLRSVIGAPAREARRWLFWFEDLETREARFNGEARREAEMRGLMDAIDSGVLLLDAEGNIRALSDRFAEIMGVEKRRLAELGTIDALIDSLAGRFSHSGDTAARWREHVRRGDEASWDEFELVRPSRKVVERFSRPVLAADGSRLGWLEVYRDITGQRLIQSKLLQTEKMAALGQLVSGIAHELNNPLTSIQGYAQLLVGRRPGADLVADARRISEEAARAGGIVKNLLLFAREARPERRAISLNEIVERTLALRSYELKIENIGVEFNLEPSLPPTLGDAGQLQQVVLNLVVNAEQAIQQGRGQGRIRIRTRRLAGDRIALEISDDGPGIPPEIVSRIFDPFFTTKPAGVGTGLGLSIVYGIVHEHGGEVSVDSQPGDGATLTVELPALTGAALAPTEEQPAAMTLTAAVVPAALPSATAISEHILVVEDEPTVAQLIADVLGEEGHRVDTLLDSREAVGQLRAGDYGLVICDLKMPHLDGPGLYRELVRTRSPLQNRLLFVTGDTMSPRTLEFLRSSGLPYLAKPFLVEELKQAVRRALKQAPADGKIRADVDSPRTVTRKR
jgi:signal transduction histidine kinase/CheY-like chemotaxis protein